MGQFCHAATVEIHFAVSHQVKNAVLAGAKGIIMFSDPADYSAAGVKARRCVHACVFVSGREVLGVSV